MTVAMSANRMTTLERIDFLQNTKETWSEALEIPAPAAKIFDAVREIVVAVGEPVAERLRVFPDEQDELCILLRRGVSIIQVDIQPEGLRMVEYSSVVASILNVEDNITVERALEVLRWES